MTIKAFIHAAAAAALFAAVACSNGSGNAIPSGAAAIPQTAYVTNPSKPHAPATTMYASVVIQSQTATSELVAFSASANGSVKPTQVIAGSATGLHDARYLRLDSSGHLWVSSCPGGSTQASVSAFPITAKGNVAPLFKIGGAKTGFSNCAGQMAFDADGNMYVADIKNQILVFSKGANGNLKYVRRIAGAATKLSAPSGLALDGKGSLYVSNSCVGGTCGGAILVFKTTDSGNVAPVRTISGSKTTLNQPMGLAFNPGGYLYVANNSANSILIFSPTASGNVAPKRTMFDQKAGDSMQFPTQLAFDAAGYLYVANDDALYVYNQPLLVFAPAMIAPTARGTKITSARSVTLDIPNVDFPAGAAVN